MYVHLRVEETHTNTHTHTHTYMLHTLSTAYNYSDSVFFMCNIFPISACYTHTHIPGIHERTLKPITSSLSLPPSLPPSLLPPPPSLLPSHTLHLLFNALQVGSWAYHSNSTMSEAFTTSCFASRCLSPAVSLPLMERT